MRCYGLSMRASHSKGRRAEATSPDVAFRTDTSPMREGPERIPVVVEESYEDLARRVAPRIAEIIRPRRAEGRPAVLGLATGSTPVGIYRELIRLHRDEGLDFSEVVTFNLDEYYPMAPQSLHSYHRFMWENLFEHV